MGKKALATVVIVSAAVLAIGVLASGVVRPRPDETGEMPVHEVRRAPLTISIDEAGTIRSLDQKIIKCEVEGRTTIISIIDEGTRVEEGDLLIELDASSLEDQRVDQLIRVQNTEAAYIRAREQLEVTKSQNQSDISEAALAERFAREDLTRYLEGEYPSQLMDAQAAVTLAEEDLRRAKDKLDWSTRLYGEKYISETEFKADELAFKRADLEVRLAQEALRLLEEYTHPRRVDELEAAIEQTELALERVKRKAAADLVQAKADLAAKKAEFDQQKERLAKVDDQIAKTRIHAPVAGMVVYATSAQFSWRGNDEPLDEGREVREREELIYLPTADSMMVEIKVHESALGKVSVGQRASVEVGATGRRYEGVVSRIAPLPDPTSVWLNPDLKVFTTDIVIEGSHRELRTGMSCEVTIGVESHEDAIAIPVQCVVRENGRPTAYVVRGGELVRTPIEVGLDDNAVVHVRSGLEPGELVSMTPPLDRGQTRQDGASPIERDEGAPGGGRRSVTAAGGTGG